MKFSSSVLALFSQDIGSTLLKISLSAFIARILGPSQLGILIILFVLLDYADKLGRLRLEDGAVFLIKKGQYEFSKAYKHLLWLTIPQILITAAALILLKGPILRSLLKGQIIPDSTYALMLAHVPAIFLITNTRKLLSAANLIKAYNLTFLLIPTLQISLLTIRWLLYGYFNLEWVLTSSLAAYFSAWFAGHYWLEKEMPDENSPAEQKPLTELFRVGLKFYGSSLPTFFQNRIDLLMLAYFLVPEHAAYYSLATTAAELLWKLPNAAQTLFFPASTSMTDKDASQFALNTTRKLFFILGPAALCGAVLIYPAVYILYGPSYLPVIPPFLMLLPGALALGLGKVSGSYLQGRGQLRALGLLSLAALLVNAGLNLALIPRLQSPGAAIASSVSYMLTSFLLIRLIIAQSGKPWTEILPGREDWSFYLSHLKEFSLKRYSQR